MTALSGLPSLGRHVNAASRKSLKFKRSNFCKDHRDKTEVPDPPVVDDLISYKLNNRQKLARPITLYIPNFRLLLFKPSYCACNKIYFEYLLYRFQIIGSYTERSGNRIALKKEIGSCILT